MIFSLWEQGRHFSLMSLAALSSRVKLVKHRFACCWLRQISESFTLEYLIGHYHFLVVLLEILTFKTQFGHSISVQIRNRFCAWKLLVQLVFWTKIFRIKSLIMVNISWWFFFKPQIKGSLSLYHFSDLE